MTTTSGVVVVDSTKVAKGTIRQLPRGLRILKVKLVPMIYLLFDIGVILFVVGWLPLDVLNRRQAGCMLLKYELCLS